MEQRYVSYQCDNKNSEVDICDKYLPDVGKWYMAEIHMPVSPPDIFSCGTTYPIWFKGEIPKLFNQVSHGKGCVKKSNSITCEKEYPVEIKHCGSYKAYHLRPSTKCPEAYCFAYAWKEIMIRNWDFGQVMVHGHDLAVLVAKGFARLDTNHDGILEMNEYEAVLKRDDSNGDGSITCDEYVAHSSAPKALALEIFHNLDNSDTDCVLSHQEALEVLKMMDQTGDGIVTEHEFEHYYLQHFDEICKHVSIDSMKVNKRIYPDEV